MCPQPTSYERPHHQHLNCSPEKEVPLLAEGESPSKFGRDCANILKFQGPSYTMIHMCGIKHRMTRFDDMKATTIGCHFRDTDHDDYLTPADVVIMPKFPPATGCMQCQWGFPSRPKWYKDTHFFIFLEQMTASKIFACLASNSKIS